MVRLKKSLTLFIVQSDAKKCADFLTGRLKISLWEVKSVPYFLWSRRICSSPSSEMTTS